MARNERGRQLRMLHADGRVIDLTLSDRLLERKALALRCVAHVLKRRVGWEEFGYILESSPEVELPTPKDDDTERG